MFFLRNPQCSEKEANLILFILVFSTLNYNPSLFFNVTSANSKLEYCFPEQFLGKGIRVTKAKMILKIDKYKTEISKIRHCKRR